MNKRKLSIIFILSTLTIMTALYSTKGLITNAAINYEEPYNIIFQASSDDIYATKLMTHDIDSPASGNNSYIGETFSINIYVENIGTVDLVDVNITSPESDLEAIGYEDEWFTITNDPNRWIGDLPFEGNDNASIVYSITPHRAGTYIFGGSNITYSNGTHSLYYITNEIEFTVFDEAPSVKLEKILFIDGEETKDGRIKREQEFFIRIRATNYFYEDVNVTIFENYPGDLEDFNFNDTLLDETHVLGVISSDASETFQYNLSALTNGTFIIPKCDGNFNFIGNLTKTPISSNTVTLFVYDPIYEGNDWTKRVPMLSVTKYFQIEDEDGNLINRTKVQFTNATIEEVTIIINITNAGIVDATNILVKEQVYNEWVFITDGVPELWGPFNLSRYESRILNYTILPIIVGEFKIEPTEITYEYINQENLLLETDNKLYSNIIEIVIIPIPPITVLTLEWWATIGISLGIVAFVAIPLVITILMYRNRRKFQKGT